MTRIEHALHDPIEVNVDFLWVALAAVQGTLPLFVVCGIIWQDLAPQRIVVV